MNRIFKTLLWLVGGLAVFIAIAFAVVYLTSRARMSATYQIGRLPLDLSVSAGSPKRGKHLAEAVGVCTDCHGKDLGGRVMVDDPMFGRLTATNLTAGEGGFQAEGGHESERQGGGYQEAGGVREDVVLAIRFGINPDNRRSLRLMPSQNFYFLTDRDLADIIAYLQTIPPVDRKLPETSPGIIARLQLLQGGFPLLPAELIDRDAKRPAPKPAVTKQYGRYLATVAGCRDCHHGDLRGGPVGGSPPGTPPAGNLTLGGDLKDWSKDEFFRAMRLGRTPDGRKINEFMPWKFYRKMTDAELSALWVYLRSVPRRVGRQ